MYKISILFSIITCGYFFVLIHANTECVWATGRVVCNKNQSSVVGAVVEVWDLDSPQNVNIKNPVDPDDKVGFSLVEDDTGVFNVEGCASDVDWLIGIHKNRPEFYIRIHHYCNSPGGEFKTVEQLCGDSHRPWLSFAPRIFAKDNQSIYPPIH